MAAPDEETSLMGRKPGSSDLKLSLNINIEIFRFYALVAVMLLLVVGTVVTNTFVEFPEGSGGFHAEQTFIYELFHFNHTCTVLNFNPSKTISALFVMLHILPMDLFVVLSYFRIKHDFKEGEVPEALWLYTRIITPLVFTSTTYFYMVFVNSPSDLPSFVLHYIPYMCWQIGMILIAIEQCIYITVKKIIPFGIHPTTLMAYSTFLVALGTYYTVYVWSFVLGTPILDTTEPVQLAISQGIMYAFDIFAILIPCIFAWVQSKNGNNSVIDFYDTD